MNLIVRQLGLRDYEYTLQAMREFTEQRHPDTPDEIWLLEHPPVFTLGLAGKEEHLLEATEIPLMKVERGGQITYHGPGQLVCYTLLNLPRLNITIRQLVSILEQSVIDLLHHYELAAQRKDKAPGVYLEQAKVAALGLRVRKGNTFHGLAINIDMDLSPFKLINPCGYPDLQITQLKHYIIEISLADVAKNLIKILSTHLNYNEQQRQIFDHL